jgi:hypothetical protein
MIDAFLALHHNLMTEHIASVLRDVLHSVMINCTGGILISEFFLNEGMFGCMGAGGKPTINMM